MRRLCVLVGALLILARLGAAEAGEWTFRADAGLESKFVRRGVQRAGAVAAPNFQLNYGAWAFEADVRMPFANSQGDEISVSTGYTHQTTSGAIWSATARQFSFGHDGAGQPAQTTELSAMLVQPFGPGRIVVELTRDFRREANIGELSYAGEYPLKSFGAFLNYRFYMGSVAARDVLPGLSGRITDSYCYHGIDLTMPYRVGGDTTLVAGLHGASTSSARPFWSPESAPSGAKFWVSLAFRREF